LLTETEFVFLSSALWLLCCTNIRNRKQQKKLKTKKYRKKLVASRNEASGTLRCSISNGAGHVSHERCEETIPCSFMVALKWSNGFSGVQAADKKSRAAAVSGKFGWKTSHPFRNQIGFQPSSMNPSTKA